MSCSYCHQEAMPADARFCPRCGQPQPALTGAALAAAIAATRQSELFFGPIVATYLPPQNPRFISRNWLAAEVEARLHERDCRFVLLTAEPGAGKSAFIAQLANDHPDWLVYFIRRDQVSPLDVGAHSFLLQIGYQLAALYPALFTREYVQLIVEQQIGMVADQGQAVGAEIERVLASPFFQQVIRVRQRAATVQGNLTGLHIKEFAVEPRALPVENLQHMALLNPAQALLPKDQDPDRQLVVLIDGLDELRYHHGGATILDWLRGLTDQLPANLRFVLTSRPPDGDLVTFIEQHKSQLCWLSIAPQDERITRDLDKYVREIITPQDERVAQDLDKYVQQIIAMPEVASLLVGREEGISRFTTDAVNKADGNIGYLDALARGIDQALTKPGHPGLDVLLKLQQLPDNIQGLYAFFLHQIASHTTYQSIQYEEPKTCEIHWLKLWPDVCQRLLGVLAVARAPLGVDQLRQLGGILPERDRVIEAIGWLRQFLDQADGGYRLYHQTVAEFLGSDTTRDYHEWQDLYVAPQRWHRQIIRHYCGQGWRCVDDYGVQHLVTTHLCSMQQGADSDTELPVLLKGCAKLFSREYFDCKKALTGSEQPFLRDVQIVLPLVDYQTAMAICQQIIYKLPPNSFRQMNLLRSITMRVRENADLHKQFSKDSSFLARIICAVVEKTNPADLVATLKDELQQLKASNRRGRIVVYLALGLSGDTIAEPILLSGLQEVREQLARTDQKYSEAWYKVGWAAAEGLRELGRTHCSEATVSVLRAMLQDSSTRERTLALYILSRGGFFEPVADTGCTLTPLDQELVKTALQQALSPSGRRTWTLCSVAADALAPFRKAYPEAITQAEAVQLLRGFLSARFCLKKLKSSTAIQRARAFKRVIAALGSITEPDEALRNELLSYRLQTEQFVPTSSDEEAIRTGILDQLDAAMYDEGAATTAGG